VHGVVRTLEDLFWVTMPDSPVKTIKDLEGKKIAFTRPKSVSETMIRWMLQRNNLMGKVEMLSLGGVGAGLSALEKGAVDAALILEPLYSARKDKYRVVFTLAELPPMVQMVAVATGDFIREHPDQVKALVSAWRKSVDYTYANPGEAAALMSKRFGDKSFKLDVAQSAVQNMSKIKFWSRGEVDREGLKVWLKTMIEQGEWEGDADWDNMIDESFLDADLKA
jgi:NitT/TauT family transport system substrate-binding protein